MAPQEPPGLSQSLPLTLFNFVSQENSGERGLKVLYPQNRMNKKQKVLKQFEQICLTIEKGNSFGCDAMAIEMNKSKPGQEQINLRIIAEKKKELCHVLTSGKSDQKK